MQNTNSGAQKKQPSGFWLVLMKNLAQQRPQPLAVGLASKYLDDSKYFESRRSFRGFLVKSTFKRSFTKLFKHEN